MERTALILAICEGRIYRFCCQIKCEVEIKNRSHIFAFPFFFLTYATGQVELILTEEEMLEERERATVWVMLFGILLDI